jgi:dolichyl-phosphate beta-glucosyltransferase
MIADTLAHLTAPDTPRRSVEIIVVDDGSTDDTHSTALKLAASFPKHIEMRAIRLKKNRGKGGGVQIGLLGSRGKRVLMVDADGASKFSDLEMLWKEMDTLENVYASSIAIGSRAHLVGTEAVVKVCSATQTLE